MMEVIVITGTLRLAKLQSNRYRQQSNTQLYSTGRMPFLSPNQHSQSTWRENHATHTSTGFWLLAASACIQLGQYAGSPRNRG